MSTTITTTTNGGIGDKTMTTTIEEGSTVMTFPADQESTVFYNPVQVQNRDLSILMITLYAERRAVAKAVKQEAKLLKQRQEEVIAEEVGTKSKLELKQARSESAEKIAQQLEEYQKSLNGRELIEQQQQGGEEDKGLCVLDALAASGLRSIRYWKEIAGVHNVTINDLESLAVERARANVRNNNLADILVDFSTKQQSRPPRGICIQQGDAKKELYLAACLPPPQPHQYTPSSNVIHQQHFRWDVIDLDPYGSAAPFLDGAVQAVVNGGLLCITCTDMAALGGSHPETCFGRYASIPIQRAGYLQEAALRILLFAISSSAARYGRTIHPVLSVGMNFYIRVFCEIRDNKAGVNQLSLSTGNVYQSPQCPTFVTVPLAQLGGNKGTVYQAGRAPGLCPETGAAFKVGGPMWLGPLHDETVVQAAQERLDELTDNCVMQLATKDRLRGLLESCREELNDVPLFYRLPDLAKTLGCSSPPLVKVKSALVNAGYRVSAYHKEPQALKTDAPSQVVWDIMRVWSNQQGNKKVPKEGSAAAKILANEPTINVDFSTPKGLKKKATSSVARFPQNPQPNWGPKPKAASKRKAAPANTTKDVETNEENNKRQASSGE